MKIPKLISIDLHNKIMLTLYIICLIFNTAFYVYTKNLSMLIRGDILITLWYLLVIIKI